MFMLKAELGDFLYIIIFSILMLVGVFEKLAKAKRQQQQQSQPQPPDPYDDFGDVEQPSAEQAPPQTLEDLMRRMMQTIEAPQQEEVVSSPEEAQSLEYIPLSGRHFYHPEEIRIREQSEINAFSPPPMEEQMETSEIFEYGFDIRQAVIASEILNRKY